MAQSQFTPLPLRLVLAIPAIASMAICSAAAAAECPGNGPPHTIDDVINTPQLLQVCRTLGGQGGCDSPSAPTVTNASTQAQELTLQATVPAGFTAASVWWRAYSFDPNVGPVELWEQVSKDGVPTGGWAPGSVVTLGAPGLIENMNHEFRVSFCDSNGGCMCWSPYSQEYSTSGFSGAAPAPPTNTTMQVEDNFRRRPTGFKSAGGDGLGPNAVWMEKQTGPVTRIADDGETALALEGGTGVYLGRQATHQHSYTEALFKKYDLSQSGYNFELHGRIHMVTDTTVEAYILKLVQGWRGCNGNAVMLVLRADEDASSGTCSGNVPLFPSADWIYLPASPPVGTCNEAPPLGSGASVWVRLEMNDAQFGDPQVTGTVAWGCPSTGDISTCAHVCTLTRTDAGDPHQMAAVKGEWGFTGHDVGYLIDTFRAGSQVP